MTHTAVVESFPLWTIAPFAAYLLIIALTPLFAGRFWERNLNKLLVAGVVSLPVLAFLLSAHPGGGHLLAHTVREYAGFMALLATLYVVSGGIHVRGSFTGTPLVNAGFLLVGSLLASLIGTTGASVLLIRPLLRANAARPRVRHVVIFFIFTVSNGAGLLTPLGDPPLFLGFLRGVPFGWTLRLFPAWAMLNGVLLALFILIDWHFHERERKHQDLRVEESPTVKEKLRIDGGLNLLWLAAVPAVIAVMGAFGPRWFADSSSQNDVQVVLLAAIAALSLLTTSKAIHRANHFSWAPIVEVAVVFLGIFVTMVPALGYLEAHGGTLGITQPWQFFWASGVLSSFLDNAPTYLTFTSLAVGVLNQTHGTHLVASDLGPLAAHPVGATLLTAVSCGAVFMGAVTYIGNGPNFMVKAIAEQARVPMPGFFGYMVWSGAILLPTFLLVTVVFF